MKIVRLTTNDNNNNINNNNNDNNTYQLLCWPFWARVIYDGGMYNQPTLYRHSIQRQNSLQWQFECYEIFAQEVTVNEKLCKNIA